MWSSSSPSSPSSTRGTGHLSGTRSDGTSSPLDANPAEPATNASEPSITNNIKSATLEQTSTSNPTATSTATKATTTTIASILNTASSTSISTSSRSSFPYWILGYGLLGLVGLTPALTAHGLRSLVWNPVIILSTLVPLFLAPALLGLDRISAALSEDTDRHNAELDELQERHEILMEAYRDENLLKKNILLETVGKEVQDAATLAIETLRQMTPTSLFPPSVSREQLSPCTLPIPITSILGLFTTMRHLQYISRNMQRLSRVMFTEYVQGIVEKTSPHYHRGENGFDVGEFVQSLGDLVSADASLKGVEFVIYHSEYGLSHVPIKGSEESWRHALINLIKSIIDSAKPGSTVELCLVLFALPQPEVEKNKVMVTFEITYYPNPASTSNEDDLAQLNALLASKLVKAMGGALEIQALEDFAKKFIVSVEVELNQSGLLQDEKSASTSSSSSLNPKTSTEPTVLELLRFSRKLGGVKVVLLSREHSAFGVRLLGYLKTWGIHVTTKTIRDADGAEGEGESGYGFTTEDPQTPTGATKRTNSSSSLSGKPSDASGKTDASKAVSSPAFIMIDDDVRVLGQQILKLQSTPPSPGPGSTTPKGRPTHRRHKSITSIQHTSIIYFTSLPTFKQARDTIMLILGTQMPGVHYSIANTLAGHPPSQGPLPYILVLPKPAGPRRVLTAIHTAINVPVLDQTYSPIATAPTSPAPMLQGILFDPTASRPQGTLSPSPGGPGQRRISNGNSRYSSYGSEGSAYVIPPATGIVQHQPFSAMHAQRTADAVAVKPQTPSPDPTPTTTSQSAVLPAGYIRFSNGQVMRPGATSNSSISNHGTSPLPITPETTANRSRSGATPAKKAKDTGAKATTSLVKSGVVERVSPLVNVLIVEDNMINQTILIKFMQRRKIKFDVACNGREAMDIQMPVMDGIEATREIRQLEKAQRIGVFPTDKPNSIGNTMSLMAASASASSSATSPQGATTPSSPFRSPVIIVALTASAESEESRNTALLAGCNDYITKPIDLPWLERKIVEWGCMQALIDVDAWKEWKRDLDGTSPGSPSAGPSVGGTAGASAALKQSLTGPGKLTQGSLRRPSSTRWTKGNKAAAAAAAAAVAAKNAVADADAAAGSGPDNNSPALTPAKTKITPKSAVSTTAATLTKTKAAADDALVPVLKSSPGIPLTTTETTSAIQSDSSTLVPDEDSPLTVN
ncbi:MAG: hypothetical protein JOS17DRAFT_680944 [Linnemannia elongata]|nr:MAG: hypothetical protein JOS17DRAFT_680944 [Linnemannia elongata]